MSNISHSALRVMAICFVLIWQMLHAAGFDCSMGNPSFIVRLSHNEYAKFSEAKLNVAMKKESVSIHAYKSTDSLEIDGNEVSVFFTGSYKVVENNGTELQSLHSISEVFHDRLTGTAVKRMLDSAIWQAQECRVVLLPRIVDSSGEHVAIAREIHRRAESCVQMRLCSRVQSIKFDGERARGYASVQKLNLQTFQDGRNFINVEMETTDPSVDKGTGDVDSRLGLQEVINAIVDLTIHHVTNQWKTENQGMFNISEANYCMTRWGPCWVFKNGKLGNYTTLARKSDAVLIQEQQKITAESEFIVGMLHLNYNVVELTSSLFATVLRSVTAFIPNVRLRLRISGDYNRYPCSLILEDIKITIPENIIIQLDGSLGILESMLTAIASVSRPFFSEKIELWAKGYFDGALSKFDCESFRL